MILDENILEVQNLFKTKNTFKLYNNKPENPKTMIIDEYL